MKLGLFINLLWREGLECEQVQLFNLTECPETGASTPWDFKNVECKSIKKNSLCDWLT